MMAPLVGAQESEVTIMQTLTSNLHFLMCAFYKPDVNGRHKIILESKAFPSDHVRQKYEIIFVAYSHTYDVLTKKSSF